jgi:NAD(P)-dependent dehydrogenase (short-subunit alcohol dehydrogenase family)
VDLQLDGNVAFVTGASKGVDIVITARTAEPLEKAATQIAALTGRTAVPMAGDMSATADVERCVNATLDRFGRIDILVTCAGSSPGGLLENLTEEQWLASLNPGPVSTDRWDTLEKAFARDKGVSQDRAHELATESIPFGRICRPDEVSALVTFLASPRASFINGAHIPIDGAQRKAIMDR